jgi:hypothetical protein
VLLPLLLSLAAHAANCTAPAGARLDASAGDSTSFFAMDLRDRRAAFGGASAALSGGELALGAQAARCQEPLPPALTPPVRGEYLVCLFDEARFEKGDVIESKRLARRVVSTLGSVLPVVVEADGFRVRYVAFDSQRGLSAEITEGARFTGPARSMGGASLLGLTIGDREVSARFLRLACAWADDPAQFP